MATTLVTVSLGVALKANNMAYKPLMDWFDEHEGRKAGDSHKAIEKEKVRQGYAKSKAVAKKKDSFQKTSRVIAYDMGLPHKRKHSNEIGSGKYGMK